MILITLVQTSVKIEDWQLESAKLAKLNLSNLLRTAINAALNIEDDLEKEEAEIQKQKAIIAAREEMIQLKKRRKQEFDDELIMEKNRLQYLQEHPDILTEFRKDTISSKGYRKIQQDLGFPDMKHVKEFLAKQKGGPAKK